MCDALIHTQMCVYIHTLRETHSVQSPEYVLRITILVCIHTYTHKHKTTMSTQVRIHTNIYIYIYIHIYIYIYILTKKHTPYSNIHHMILKY
jgi:hypothetical protein